MTDIKFNMNKPPLSKDEIASSKDFNKVLKGNSPKPEGRFSKGAIVGIIAIVIAGVSYFIYQQFQEPSLESTTLKESTKESKSKITFNPPVNGIETTYETFEINNDIGGEYISNSGSEFIIPQGAILDENKQPVTGGVTLKIREFHDVASIFSSGIPMIYDSLGQDYHFESAGMFEILPNEPNHILNGNTPVTVKLNSKQSGNHFNLYFLDNNKDWQFIEKDTAGITLPTALDDKEIEQLSKAIKKAKKDWEKSQKKYEKELVKAQIIEPQLANDNNFSIQLDYNIKEFPELSNFSNVLFEVLPENENFDPSYANEEWKDIKLSKKGNDYELALISHSLKVNLIVAPVFASKDIDFAEETFQTLFEAYDIENENRLSTAKKEMDELNAIYLENEMAFRNNEISINNLQVGNANNYDLINAVTRIFRVEQFGMYNSDCPARLPKGKEITPLFVTDSEEKDTLNFSTIYIAEIGSNTLFTLSGNWSVQAPQVEGEEPSILSDLITYNPSKKTVLWGVSDGAVYKVDYSKLNEISEDEDIVEVKMTKSKKEDLSSEGMRNFLSIN